MKLKHLLLGAALAALPMAMSAKDYVYEGTVNASVNHAMVGSDYTDLTATLPWKMTFHEESNSATYEIDLTTIQQVVGLVPRVSINDSFYDLSNEGNGWHKYDIASATKGETVSIRHFSAYNQGDYNILEEVYTTWGMESTPADPNAKSISLTASAQNVTFNSAEIDYEVSTTGEVEDYTVYYKLADGEAIAATASPIQLTGLTERTTYTYNVYAKAGDLESNHVTVTVKTTAENARDYVYNDVFETVFTNAWVNGQPVESRGDLAVSLPWRVTYTKEGHGVYEINLSQVENLVGIVPKVWSYGFYDLIKNTETGWWYYDFGEKVLDSAVAISHYIPYDGGGIDRPTEYTKWGLEKALPFSVTASVDNVTFNSAEITYSVIATDVENYTVYYKLNDGEAVQATESPIKLEGLTEHTDYSVEVYAMAGDRKSDATTITFKTPAQNAIDLVYADYLNAEFKNAYYIGQPESSRHTIYAALPFSVTYTKQGTAIYEIDLSQVENIVGLTPQIYWNGFKNLSKNTETGKWEFNFGEQELDANTAISHYFPYNGGGIDVNFSKAYGKWGIEKELPVLGEPASLELSAAKNACVANESVDLYVVAKDANGYYLAANNVEYTSSDNRDKFKGDTVTISSTRGIHTITAVLGDLTKTYEIMCIATYYSENVIAGMIGTTCEDHSDKNLAHVTDASRTTELIWSKGHEEEHPGHEGHYLIYDLTQKNKDGLYVEAVEVYFEGAYAKNVKVKLTNTLPSELAVPAENAINALADTPADDVVLTSDTEGTQHYLLNDITAKDQKHKYVVLNVSEPLNSDWGIKLRDMKVYATDNDDVVSVEGIAVDDSNAPVEYFDLNGIRVNGAELAPGLYIKKQGAKAEKVLVK